MSAVLDASAILAALFDEPGKEKVEGHLEAGAVIGAVNLAEVASKLVDLGFSDQDMQLVLANLGVEVAAFDAELALDAGYLRAATRSLGLSLGDRACLALARRQAKPAVTADRIWRGLSGLCDVEVIQ